MIVFAVALVFAALAGAAITTLLLLLTGEGGAASSELRRPLAGRWSKYRDGQALMLSDLGLAAHLSFWSYMAVRLLVALFCGLLAAPVFGGILGAAVGGLAYAVEGAGLRAAHRRRGRLVSAAVAEVGQSILSMMRAGTPLLDAISALGEAGPPLLRAAMDDLARNIREVGMERALAVCAGEVRDPLFDLLAVSIQVQHATGGESFEELEYTIEAVSIQQAQLDRAAAMQAQTRTAAVLIPLAMVFTVMFLEWLNGSRPGGYFAFYRTTTGQLVQLVYFALFAAGYFVMRRLQRVNLGGRIRLRAVE